MTSRAARLRAKQSHQTCHFALQLHDGGGHDERLTETPMISGGAAHAEAGAAMLSRLLEVPFIQRHHRQTDAGHADAPVTPARPPELIGFRSDSALPDRATRARVSPNRARRARAPEPCCRRRLARATAPPSGVHRPHATGPGRSAMRPSRNSACKMLSACAFVRAAVRTRSAHCCAECQSPWW